MEENGKVTIGRRLNVGINVKDAKLLPKVGTQLAEFLKRVDHPHGPFDVNIAVSVEPTDASAIGPVELPVEEGEAPTVEIVYVGGTEDDELEGA